MITLDSFTEKEKTEINKKAKKLNEIYSELSYSEVLDMFNYLIEENLITKRALSQSFKNKKLGNTLKKYDLQEFIKIKLMEKPTRTEWDEVILATKVNLDTSIKIRSEIGEYFIDHFTNVLPPIIHSDRYVLCSEPYSHDKNNMPTYLGIYKRNDDYFGIITTEESFKQLIK